MQKGPECAECVARYIRVRNHSRETLKEVGYIFGRDPSDMERIFRARTGRTVKEFADEQKKEELIQLLAGGFRYGYEIGGALGFKTDQSFYHWVGLVFGVTFRKLRSVLRQETTYSGRARM